ncbi:MAG: hypothetical protein EKK31_05315 [Hyphomicrobiales bacterium]|jgi:hypothetical protein|nr:MAG: hypothetical protein EKK31_05315 [Hyphomicrobiales bacterium]
MIVYNVGRRWFSLKADAETYRIGQKLPPDATIRISIVDRVQLASLLDALCEPPAPGDTAAAGTTPVPARVIDQAYVDPDFEIPRFLRESWARLTAGNGE